MKTGLDIPSIYAFKTQIINTRQPQRSLRKRLALETDIELNDAKENCNKAFGIEE